jgi:hypothetical protein
MIRYMKLMGGLLLAGALVACGGGGGSPGATTGTGGGGGTTQKSTPAALEVFTSSAELSSATNSSLTFTVVVKDANNQAIPGQTVTFSASSGNLAGSLPIPLTGSNGEAITSVSLSPGADRTNRIINVTITAGGVSQVVKIPVVGTTITVSNDSSILLGASTTVTARITDSAGQPVPNAALTVTSSIGNTVTPASPVTNAQGAATFSYAGTRAGQDELTVSAQGAKATSKILVSADQFSFESPASLSTVAVGATQTVTVRLLSSGAPVPGATVNFSTTRGTLTPTSVVTDSTGRASTIVTSNSSGPANVVAQTGTAQVTLPLNFIAVTPASIALQVNPGAIPPNTVGSTTNQATLRATVRDAAGNPVQGRVVTFSATNDPSNGVISPGSAVTDESGTASAQFIPGASGTGNNQVLLTAAVQGTGITGSASLTVNAQALFISIATGNVVGSLNPTTYEKEFSVYVTDATGAPAANRVVQLSFIPDFYAKGFLQFTDPSWTPVSYTICANEDANRNGVLNPGEDLNRNGRLDPGLPVVVTPASVTTGLNGFATFKLQYGENFVPWLGGQLTARASVSGTESVASLPYILEGQASDFNNESVAPAGVFSPYGTATDCAAPN